MNDTPAKDDTAGPLIGWSLEHGIQGRKLDELMDFPCVYAFKVMGPADDAFETALRENIGGVLGRSVIDSEVSKRQSSKGKYQSITVNVEVETSEVVYAIYAAISNDKRVRYVL